MCRKCLWNVQTWTHPQSVSPCTCKHFKIQNIANLKHFWSQPRQVSEGVLQIRSSSDLLTSHVQNRLVLASGTRSGRVRGISRGVYAAASQGCARLAACCTDTSREGGNFQKHDKSGQEKEQRPFFSLGALWGEKGRSRGNLGQAEQEFSRAAGEASPPQVQSSALAPLQTSPD